ncbi:MAG TPA: ABC transporter substrate-binding protein [Candidatus Omnitrophota bacterium]|nr:ABC transporter substrate-binding protein [Candidatus Omnitrophota bacterium]HQJ14918.1 ABC transporter substrate-binding protein [Candidatus Omnitrophota bacterium]
MTDRNSRFLKTVFFIAVAALAILPLPAAHSVGVPVKKVSCCLLWKPQAQFAGYIVAREKGFYQKRGLDVTLISGGVDNSSLKALNDKKSDFCIAWLSSAIKRRMSGVNLVNIAQVVRRSGLMLIARKSSGIVNLQDMHGRKVSLWEGDLSLGPIALFRSHRIIPEIIPQTYTVNLFLMGGVDVVSAMWYNEYDTIINAGLDPGELNTFFLSDLGFNFPEDGIYCLQDTLVRDPDAAAGFVSASFEGWRYAFDHPDEAVDLVMAYMRKEHLPANRVHQRWMLSKMRELISPQSSGSAPGTLSKDDFERVAAELLRSGLIAAAPAYDDFYRPVRDNVQD